MNYKRKCINNITVVHTQYNFDIPKDYWENGQGKPIVDYESRYHKLSASDYGARVQAWIAYLSGMCGYGYGALDMWYYNYKGAVGQTRRKPPICIAAVFLLSAAYPNSPPYSSGGL